MLFDRAGPRKDQDAFPDFDDRSLAKAQGLILLSQVSQCPTVSGAEGRFELGRFLLLDIDGAE